MSNDVRMFNLCSHIIDEEYIDEDKCPRCYGKGWYFDISFDNEGLTIVSEGTLKLQQELFKITLEEKGDNPFYELWGNEVNRRMVGGKNNPAVKPKIELLVRDCVNYLKSVQKGNQSLYQNMSNDEIISRIDSVEVIENSKTSYEVQVVITSESGVNSAFAFEVKI